MREGYIGVAPQSSRRKRHPLIGVYCMVVSMSMLFLGLCTVLLFFQLSGKGWPPPGSPRLNLVLPTATMLTLLASSGTMRWASLAVRRGSRNGLRWGLVLSLALGGLFLANQVYLFFETGLPIGSGLYIAILYILIALHAFHMIGGMIFLGVTLARANAGDFTPQHHVGLDACEIFWQFAVWIWVVLYVLLFLI
jgi:cytochrome c oxidase subunit III